MRRSFGALGYRTQRSDLYRRQSPSPSTGIERVFPISCRIGDRQRAHEEIEGRRDRQDLFDQIKERRIARFGRREDDHRQERYGDGHTADLLVGHDHLLDLVLIAGEANQALNRRQEEDQIEDREVRVHHCDDDTERERDARIAVAVDVLTGDEHGTDDREHQHTKRSGENEFFQLRQWSERSHCSCFEKQEEIQKEHSDDVREWGPFQDPIAGEIFTHR